MQAARVLHFPRDPYMVLGGCRTLLALSLAKGVSKGAVFPPIGRRLSDVYSPIARLQP